MAEKKYNLVFTSRKQETLDRLKLDFEEKYKIKVYTLCTDLCKNEASNKVLDFTKKNNLKVDILINCAGFGYIGQVLDADIKNLTNMINLNIITLTELCYFFAKEMKKNGSGHIMNIASTGAYQPVPYMNVYAATKSYVLNFTEALSIELEDYNIRVLCLSPGVTDTNFFEALGMKEDKKRGIFKKNSRMSAEKVAKVGIKKLFSKKISTIPGLSNKILIFLNRLFSRKLIAKISKSIMKKSI